MNSGDIQPLEPIGIQRRFSTRSGHSRLGMTFAVVALIALSGTNCDAISPTNGIPYKVVQAFLTLPTDPSVNSPLTSTNRISASGDIGSTIWHIVSSDGQVYEMSGTNAVPVASANLNLESTGLNGPTGFRHGATGVVQLAGQTNLVIAYGSNIIKGYMNPAQSTWTMTSSMTLTLGGFEVEGLSVLEDKLFVFAGRGEYSYDDTGTFLSISNDGSLSNVIRTVSNYFGTRAFSFYPGVYDCSLRIRNLNAESFVFLPIDQGGNQFYPGNQSKSAILGGITNTPSTISCTGIVPFSTEDGKRCLGFLYSQPKDYWFQGNRYYTFTNSMSFVDREAYPFLEYVKPLESSESTALPPFTLTSKLDTNGNINVSWPPQYATAQLHSSLTPDGRYVPTQVQPLPDNKGNMSVTMAPTNQGFFRLAK